MLDNLSTLISTRNKNGHKINSYIAFKNILIGLTFSALPSKMMHVNAKKKRNRSSRGYMRGNTAA